MCRNDLNYYTTKWRIRMSCSSFNPVQLRKASISFSTLKIEICFDDCKASFLSLFLVSQHALLEIKNSDAILETEQAKKKQLIEEHQKVRMVFLFSRFVVHTNFDFEWNHHFFASQVKTERDVLCRQSTALLMKWENPEVVMEDLLKVENLMHDNTNKDQNVSDIFLFSKTTSW